MKTALITGGSNGIGEATANKFLNNGYRVIVLDPSPPKNITNENLIYINGKIESQNEIEKAVEKIKSENIFIDVLVNNAGFFNGKGLEASSSDWEEILKVNVIGTFLMVKNIVPVISTNGGAIVNVASISGIIAQPNYLLYSATKAAIINMTKCMALDLVEMNIRVNSVSPSTVWTENNEFYIGRDFGVNKEEAGYHPQLGGRQIINRVAAPEEVASVIYFLSMQDSSFITGENIKVDGGYTAR